MTDPTPTARTRRGFTLLEVMIATGILVVSLVILVETQATAAQMTIESDRIMVATQLAQEKLAEVRLLIEREGFQTADVHEQGDFDDFGDEVLNLQFEDALDDFHWEYLIHEVDLEVAGDLMGSVNSLAEAYGMEGGLGGGGSAAAAGGGMDLGAMSSFLSPDMITNALDPFVREVRVRVWWGEDLDEAEELGNEVVITQHVANPAGQARANQLGGQGGGGQGGANQGGVNQQGANPGGTRGRDPAAGGRR